MKDIKTKQYKCMKKFPNADVVYPNVAPSYWLAVTNVCVSCDVNFVFSYWLLLFFHILDLLLGPAIGRRPNYAFHFSNRKFITKLTKAKQRLFDII